MILGTRLFFKRSFSIGEVENSREWIKIWLKMNAVISETNKQSVSRKIKREFAYQSQAKHRIWETKCKVLQKIVHQKFWVCCGGVKLKLSTPDASHILTQFRGGKSLSTLSFVINCCNWKAMGSKNMNIAGRLIDGSCEEVLLEVVSRHLNEIRKIT